MCSGMTEFRSGGVGNRGSPCARFPLYCGKTSETPSCPHLSVSISSRKDHDDYPDNFHRREKWTNQMGPFLSEEHIQYPFANARLVKGGNFGEQPGRANQARTQARRHSATPGNCSTREPRAGSDGFASVRSFAAGRPVRPAGERVLSPRCARTAFLHILSRSTVGSRPRGHHGRGLLNRVPRPRPLRHLPVQLVPAFHQGPAAEAPHTWRQGLVSCPQLS